MAARIVFTGLLLGCGPDVLPGLGVSSGALRHFDDRDMPIDHRAK
jgi:hypothetical protein